MPTIRLLDLRCHVARTATRFPFRYGIAAMTAAPHLFLRGEFEIGGKRVIGFSAEGLPPKWFTKSPDTTFDEDLPELIEAIRRAISAAHELGEQPGFFDWWRELYRRQDAWSGEQSVPPLLAHLGTSLVERAGIDALCRAVGRSFAEAVAADDLGLRLEEIHPELADADPVKLIQVGRGSGSTLSIRHTVGLADPLTDADIAGEDRVDDGLPQSLRACIHAYGLRYFKIKLSGDADHDIDRLRRIAALLDGEVRGDYHHTLDGNEQFRELADFRELWERLRSDSALADFLSPSRLLFVEQPLHRDVALDDGIAEALRDWQDAPPLIIDESDATLGSAKRALDLGYAGTSHKNCKGVVKGFANAALLRKRAADEPGRRWILSGEDLANVGPVALLQDLTVMHALGIAHVERNGHHYFPGLKMFDDAVGDAVLACHGDLYRQHEHGGETFPAPRIRDGRIDIGSVLAAPFGTGFAMDDALTEWKSLDQWRDDGAFRGY